MTHWRWLIGDESCWLLIISTWTEACWLFADLFACRTGVAWFQPWQDKLYLSDHSFMSTYGCFRATRFFYGRRLIISWMCNMFSFSSLVFDVIQMTRPSWKTWIKIKTEIIHFSQFKHDGDRVSICWKCRSWWPGPRGWCLLQPILFITTLLSDNLQTFDIFWVCFIRFYWIVTWNAYRLLQLSLRSSPSFIQEISRDIQIFLPSCLLCCLCEKDYQESISAYACHARHNL